MGEIKYPFGDKIRKIRERRGMTMKDVATRAGISESMISQIERDRVSPSLDTLLTMAKVLRIDFEYLFQNYKKANEVSIVRAKKRNQVIKGPVRYEQLSRFSDGAQEHTIEAFLLTIESGAEKGDQEYGHPGSELGFVLQGNGKLFYGKEVYELEEGDSLSFRSDNPHRLQNTGDIPLKAVWVITPPRFIS